MEEENQGTSQGRNEQDEFTEGSEAARKAGEKGGEHSHSGGR